MTLIEEPAYDSIYAARLPANARASLYVSCWAYQVQLADINSKICCHIAREAARAPAQTVLPA